MEIADEFQMHCGGGCIPSNIFLDQAYVKNFACSICLGVCFNAVNDEYGHVFGDKCIKKSFNAKPICPLSKQVYSKDSKFTPVYSIRNHISQAQVSCPNENCIWIKCFEDLEKHLKDCPEQRINCPNKECKEIFERKQLANHLKKTCDFQKIACSFHKKCSCQLQIINKLMLKHLMESHPEELREAADNYFNEPEKLMYYPLTSRNSDYERSSLSFATPNKFRKEFSLHDLKPICEKKDNNDEKIIIPSKQNLRKR